MRRLRLFLYVGEVRRTGYSCMRGKALTRVTSVRLESRRAWIGKMMTWASIQDVADKKVLYLTTVGRRTNLPREIEIWFVIHCDRFYLFAETGEAAAWVKNIRHNPEVVVRIGTPRISATARVLDREIDRELWDQVATIANRKYGWGDGLPVEITPSVSRATDPGGMIKPAESR
jgi:deazaflavin-dependent oxidoreductase (nitroreductase family)